MRFLNILKLDCDLIFSGRSFQSTAAAYLKECFPYVVVLTLGVSARFEYLKLYLLFLKFTKLFKHDGAKLYNILKVSKVAVRNLFLS